MAQEVDPDIWSACGGQVTLGPATSEKCVFIPQGLIEQCTSSEEVRLLCSHLPCVACSVLSIQYLADTITDEVYAKVVINYDPARYRDPTDSTQATMPASNTPSPVAPGPSNTSSPVAPGPSTMAASNTRPPAASNTSSPLAPRPSTIQASNTRAPASSSPETLPATNTRGAPTASRPATLPAANTRGAPTASRPATLPATNTRGAPTASRPATLPATNTRAPTASRPATLPATNTRRAPTASRPATLPATNTRASTASRPATLPATNTRASTASRPATLPASNSPSPVARGQSTLPASNTQGPTASTPATMPAASTPSPVASRLTILPGFIKVIDANDLISQECTITLASLGVGAVLPKEQVSLPIRDIHGRVWLFEHRYNRILECHSLADGWKPFLDSKKLRPGDSLVFLKKDGVLTVGIRRAPRRSSSLFNMGEPLGRVGSGSLSVGELAVILGEPYNKKASDRTIKFDFFPSVHSSWFVVPVDGLKEKARQWRVGMQVRKLSMVTDQLKQVYVRGIVTGGRVVWTRAFWKNFDVKWDHTYGEREAATNAWEVEPVAEETTEPLPEEETTEPMPEEETNEERSSKRQCIRQEERNDVTLT